MDRRFDPRTIVTPYAFAVHPDLLGRRLASPWQRLGAIVVDLVFIFFLSRIGGAPLAIASAGLLFWLASRKNAREVFGQLFRIAAGCLGLVILGITALVVAATQWEDEIEEFLQETGTPVDVQTTGAVAEPQPQTQEDFDFIELVQGFRGVAALQEAETAEEAQEIMTALVRDALSAGLDRNQARDLLEGVLPDNTTWADEAEGLVGAVLAGLAIDQAEGLASEGEGGAAADPDEVQGEAETGFSEEARDSIAGLLDALQEAAGDRENLEVALAEARQALEAERNQGFLGWLIGLIDDLGIGFGWAALYLTITHAWWNGTSIGKKLFRIRVVMIDKRPLNWWLSFERAGGYAAGFATGLLGFAQVFWDPNRQAIHDKVSETIVIKDGSAPVPGPWIEEGKAQWARGRSETLNIPGSG
jgi:hypothetical protein